MLLENTSKHANSCVMTSKYGYDWSRADTPKLPSPFRALPGISDQGKN